MTDAETLGRIEDKFRDKQFGDIQIEIIMEAVEPELTGDSERNPEDRIITESGTAPRGWQYDR